VALSIVVFPKFGGAVGPLTEGGPFGPLLKGTGVSGPFTAWVASGALLSVEMFWHEIKPKIMATTQKAVSNFLVIF